MPNALKSIIAKQISNPVQEEFTANAEILPGHLVELMSTGKIRAHATAGGNAVKMWAIENELEGEGVNDAYAASDQVQVRVMNAGDQVNALIADGENISIGDFLESNGDGTLQKWEEASGAAENPPESLVGVAMEALDLSDSSGGESSGLLGDRRARIMVL
jgi:hypothetical protein